MKQIIYELQKWNENEEMIVAVNAIYAIAKRSLKKKNSGLQRVQTTLNSWIFFQTSLHNCINCIHYDDHFFIFIIIIIIFIVKL